MTSHHGQRGSDSLECRTWNRLRHPHLRVPGQAQVRSPNNGYHWRRNFETSRRETFGRREEFVDPLAPRQRVDHRLLDLLAVPLQVQQSDRKVKIQSEKCF